MISQGVEAGGRQAADRRLRRALADQVLPEVAGALLALLAAPEGKDKRRRVSEPERPRRGVFRSSSKGMVAALRRLGDIEALGAARCQRLHRSELLRHVVSSGSPLAPAEGSRTMTDARPLGADEAAFIAAARADDRARFALLTERHRRALQVHCYRMLAHYEDAQDVTQETFLRAWNKRESFTGRAALRTWLYRIATNACLDFLEKRTDRTPVPAGRPGAGSEVRYLQPYPDRMLPEDPQEAVVARETIELAFVVAVQHLPPRQRAVFILRDVLGWPASAAADALELTVASVTSALQRARVTLRARLPARRLDWRRPATHELSAAERGVVQAYIDAHERNDLAGLMALLRDDLRFAMLPEPGTAITGAKDAVDGWVAGGLFRPGYDDWRGIATTVNRMPAAALYRRTPDAPEYRLLNIAVLHIADGKIAELTGFDATDKPWLGLPPTR